MDGDTDNQPVTNINEYARQKAKLLEPSPNTAQASGKATKKDTPSVEPWWKKHGLGG